MRRHTSRIWRCSIPAQTFALLLLLGCGTVSGSATASSSTEAQVLSRAASVELRDARVKVVMSLASTTGTSSVIMVGTITKSPDRTDVTITRTSADGSPLTGESIFDVSTHTMYSRVLEPGAATGNTWTKGPLPDVGGTDYAKAFLSLPFENMKDARLVGAERVNGSDVWHIKTSATGGTIPGQLDIYLRRDSYIPVRIISHAMSQRGGEDVTCDYIAVNTGVSIALPPPQDIEGS